MFSVLNVAFVRALQDHILPSLPLVVTNVCPGFCITELRRNVDPALFTELDKTARTAEEGSRQLLWAALGPDPTQLDSAEVTKAMRGAYVANLELIEPSSVLKTEAGSALQQRLWVSYISTICCDEHDLSTVICDRTRRGTFLPELIHGSLVCRRYSSRMPVGRSVLCDVTSLFPTC